MFPSSLMKVMVALIAVLPLSLALLENDSSFDKLEMPEDDMEQTSAGAGSTSLKSALDSLEQMLASAEALKEKFKIEEEQLDKDEVEIDRQEAMELAENSPIEKVEQIKVLHENMDRKSRKCMKYLFLIGHGRSLTKRDVIALAKFDFHSSLLAEFRSISQVTIMKYLLDIVHKLREQKSLIAEESADELYGCIDGGL